VWPPSVRGLLVTESDRGDGGVLRNTDGERFMFSYVPDVFKEQYATSEEEGDRWYTDPDNNRRPPELLPRDEVARAILEVHSTGLRAMLAIIDQHAPQVRHLLEGDPGVMSLLAMHDLCDGVLLERVQAALATANDTLGSQAQAHLESLEGQRAVIRVQGREHAARELMQRSIEKLMATHAPEVLVEIAGVGEAWPKAVIPVSRLFAQRT